MRQTQCKQKFFPSFSFIHTYIFCILCVYREGGTNGRSGHKIEISCNWSLGICFFDFWVLLRLLCAPAPLLLLPLVWLQLSFPVWFARGQTSLAALKFHTLIYSFSEQNQSQSKAEHRLFCGRRFTCSLVCHVFKYVCRKCMLIERKWLRQNRNLICIQY